MTRRLAETVTRTRTVLHLAYSNAAGVPGRWAAAHRQAGLRADLLLELPDEYGYGTPATVERWSNQDLTDATRQRIADADVVMVYDSPYYLEVAIEMGKPVLYCALGTHSRSQPDWVRRLLRSPLVRRATAGTADLALALGIPLAGAPFPKLGKATMTRHIAVHSPSNRALKGTDAIQEFAGEAGWELEIVDGVSHAEVLARKKTCALVIDQFGSLSYSDGFGVAAVEAMAMGLAVISRASGEVQRMYRDIGCPAVLVSTETGLLSQLRRLHDPGARRELGDAGRAWVRSFHDGPTRAREDVVALEAA
jgi:hypothetical protein